MSLLDLPLEILDEIITLTLPSGIESFVLSCKAIHARAASQIKRHNDLKRQWKYTNRASTHNDFPLGMLYNIARDPLAAQYVESLHLWLYDGPEYKNINDFRANEEALEVIKKMVLETKCLEHASVDTDEWWEGMMEDEGEEDETWNIFYAAVLLLSQLPNLKTLQLPHAWVEIGYRGHIEGREKPWMSVLDAIVECSNTVKGYGKALGKLETILPFVLPGYDSRVGLESLQWFMQLESIRNLYAVSCLAVNDDNYTGIPFQWRFPRFESPLVSMELAYCCMDADGISVLLSRTPSLRVFKYSHQTKWHGCEHDWSAGAFVEAVGKQRGQTITTLAITLDTLYGEICTGVTSFQAFQKLQSLEVDAHIFCGPPVGCGEIRGIAGNLREGQTPWSEEDISDLGSMLPDSIVEVQLNTDFPEPDEVTLNMLLRSAKESRQTRLKNLNTFAVRQYKDDSARALVENAGATLKVVDMEGARSREMMPAWKQEFGEKVGAPKFARWFYGG